MNKLLLFITISTLLFSCDFIGGERVEGDGSLTTENRQAGNFSNVASSGPMDIVLTQSSSNAVQVEADKNLLPYVVTTTDGNTLQISTKKGYNLHPSKHIIVHVSAPVFNAISLGGSGDITTENTLTNRDKISFELNGSGDIDAKIEAAAVDSHTSGSGNISLSGRTENSNMSVAGSGDIHCFSLTSENASITINGSGNAEVYASKQLNLKVNGSGDIEYKGPASVNSNINGSGSVTKAD